MESIWSKWNVNRLNCDWGVHSLCLCCLRNYTVNSFSLGLYIYSVVHISYKYYMEQIASLSRWTDTCYPRPHMFFTQWLMFYGDGNMNRAVVGWDPGVVWVRGKWPYTCCCSCYSLSLTVCRGLAWSSPVPLKIFLFVSARLM